MVTTVLKKLQTLSLSHIMILGMIGAGIGYYYRIQKSPQNFLEYLNNDVKSDQITTFAQKILEHMGVDKNSITIYTTDGTSCAYSDKMYINPQRRKLGPLQFVIAHECAHIALDHYAARKNGITIEQGRDQEQEADLYAAKTLCEMGLEEAVYERIANLQYGCDHNWESPEYAAEDEHPTLVQNVDYLKKFMKTKNSSSDEIEKNIKKYTPYFDKMFKLK